MSHSSSRLRLGAPVTLLALVMSLFPAIAQGAEPLSEAPAKVRTSLTEVGSHRFSDGAPGGLGYKVSTEVLEPIAPDEFLPTVRVDAEQHPEAFDGQWADNGFHAAWVAPHGEYQFLPDAYTVESGYLDTYVDSAAAPMAPGDSFDMAVKQLPFDTPLTWDRERGDTDGELDWDIATKVHRIRGTYGSASSEAEILFVRADLVARGGDFDARDGSVQLPPLVIDLPQIYGPEVRGSASTAQFAPYLHYIRGLEGQVLPQSGKAVFTGTTRGYIPEAKQYVMPGGTTIREWHIPLDLIIMMTGPDGSVGARSALGMPAAGKVTTVDGTLTTSLNVPAGRTVIAGPGLRPQITAQEGDSTPGAIIASAAEAGGATTGAAEAGGGSLLEDIRATAPIDSTLAQPAQMTLGKDSFDVTIDPNLYGSGTLGLTAARHVRSDQPFFSAAAVPSVEVDGRVIPLDAARLVELRAVPQFDYIRIGFTGRSDGQALLDPTSYLRARQGRIHLPGVNIEAVYDLGDGLYAFFTGYADQGAGGAGDSFGTLLQIRSLSGAAHHLAGNHYLETSHSGPFTYDGAPVTNEFSGVSRALIGPGVTISGGASGGSSITVKDGSASLSVDPTPDPAVSLEGKRLGVYLSSTAGVTSDYYISSLASSLRDTDVAPVYAPPTIGETCAPAPVVDDAESDASATLDVRRAWFDFDGNDIYATIEVARLDETSLGSPATYRASWRRDHIGFGMQAARDVAGAWSFQLGLHPSAGSAWSRIEDIVGEVVYGAPGYIRMKAPGSAELSGSGFLSGDMFRDTGAISSDVNGIVDRAPSGTPEFAFGRGGDWTVGPCPGSQVPSFLEVLNLPLEVQHSDDLIVRARLSDASGPVGQQAVTLVFDGQERTVVTSEEGIAESSFTATGAPGQYPVTVTFGGSGDHLASQASVTASVLHEDSALTLVAGGTGINRRLTASLTDADTPAAGLAGRTIEFFSEGEFLGSAVTDDSGTAVFDAPPGLRGGPQPFEARFEGDAFYLGSEAQTSS